jgi:hypothetical protein
MARHSFIWHHGFKENAVSSEVVSIQTSDTSPVEQIRIPKELEQINTIQDALAYILGSNINLQRISGFKCSKGKHHRWSFSDCIGMCVCEYFFDTQKEVIDWARYIFIVKHLAQLFHDMGLGSHRFLLELTNYTRESLLHSLANSGKISRPMADCAIRLLHKKES